MRPDPRDQSDAMRLVNSLYLLLRISAMCLLMMSRGLMVYPEDCRAAVISID